MPRPPRTIVPGCPYHAMNRGNHRATLFHTPADYNAFCRALTEALDRYAVDLYAYCLMPNHWHLLLSERGPGQLSAFMSWVGVTHVRRHHAHHQTGGGGHLYQGRFKAFPVADGPYFRTVAHYVETNALRAGLCEPWGDRAEAWPWGSAAVLPRVRLAPWPWPRPDDWRTQLDGTTMSSGWDAVRHSVAKGRPFGPTEWVGRTAGEQGLTHTLRAPGRPAKTAKTLAEVK